MYNYRVWLYEEDFVMSMKKTQRTTVTAWQYLLLNTY